MILNSPYVSGSLTVTGNIIASGSITLSGSVASASYAASASNALAAQTASTTPNAVTTASISGPTISFSKGDASTFTVTVNNVTSASYSNNATLAANSTLLNSTASTVFATTGSNTLTGTQYISNTNDAIGFSNTTSSIYTDGGLQVTKNAYFSSSMFIKGNLTVFGTQSVSFITSSQLNIGTNLITVNTDTPSVRFGGLAVQDSGSTGLTGSILWDSQDNQWIYTNPSGSEYDSAMFLVGPRNSGTLGNEVGITTNALAKGNGAHHMTSSGIFEVSGSVGIGTSSPTTLLHISGTTGGLFEVDGAAAINALFVSASGRVGIGTTNPQQILNVYSPASSDQSYLIMAQTSGAAALFTARTSVTSTYFGTENSSAGSTINGTLANASLFANQSATALQLGTNNNIRLTITNSGSVGIGTTSPEGVLTIQGTSAQPPTSGTTANSLLQLVGSLNNQLNIGSNTVAGDYGSYIQSSDNNLAVPYPLNLQPNGGAVGIGISTPTRKLHIYATTNVFEGILVENSTSNAYALYQSRTGNSNLWQFGTWNNNSFRIGTSGVGDFLTITSGGDVGIGNTAFASTRLTVTGKSNTSSDFSFVANNSSNSNLFLVRNDGNVGVGANPNAWASPFTVIQGGSYGQHIGFQSNGPDMKIGSNNYYNGSGYSYAVSSNGAAQLNVGGNSGFQFNLASSGTAGDTITFNAALVIPLGGSLYINNASTSNFINLESLLGNAGSAIISIAQTDSNKLAKATIIVQRSAYVSGVTYSVATLAAQPIANYLTFGISGTYLTINTTGGAGTMAYNALVIPAY
jgi:hypothetical protein